MYAEHLQTFIPPEFDLAKYKATSNIDLWDWSCNFGKRCGLSLDIVDEDLILDNIENGVFVTKERHATHFNDQISLLREVNGYQVFSMSEHLDKKMDGKKLYDQIQKNDSFERTGDSELNHYISELDETYDWLMLEPAWLEVDLSCSDIELNAAFAQWLKYKRGISDEDKKQKRREYKLNEFSDATLRRWAEARVLEYLDIEAWNVLKGNDITNRLYGEILFPEYRDKRDNTAYINDKVKPLAKLLTRQETIMRMRKVYYQLNGRK